MMTGDRQTLPDVEKDMEQNIGVFKEAVARAEEIGKSLRSGLPGVR